MNKENMKDLVHKARKGDTQAFGEIYSLLVNKIYRFIYFKVSSKEDAEDLTEQTFLKAWEKIGSFKEEYFEAWIYKIASNLVIDHYRAKKEVSSIDNLEISHNGLSIEKQVELELDTKSILKAVKNLKAEYQEIIILKFIEEKENEEISKILKKPTDHVRVLQSRALKALRGLLK